MTAGRSTEGGKDEGCPVVVAAGENDPPSKCPRSNGSSSTSSSSSWWSSFGWNNNSSSSSSQPMEIPDGCPMSPSSSSKTSPMIPASVEEDAGYSQERHPDEGVVANLSTFRTVSGIPRASPKENDNSPKQQASNEGNDSNWMYPSERQFFQALRRKGWDHIEAESVPAVVQIHNNVNERTWKYIQEWEGASDIELVRFQGRPNDLSPLAFWKSYVVGWSQTRPFDRHDWYVRKKQNQEQDDNTNHNKTRQWSSFFFGGGPQRYVIDYYMFQDEIFGDSKDSDMLPPPVTYVDARPAIDSPYALWKRTGRFIQDELPYVTSRFSSWWVLHSYAKTRYYDGKEPTSRTKTASILLRKNSMTTSLTGATSSTTTTM